MAETKGGKGDKNAKPGKTDKTSSKGKSDTGAGAPVKEAKGKSRKEAAFESRAQRRTDDACSLSLI
jgi:hypothetical protein